MALHRRLQWNLWFWRRNCGKACAKCASLGSHRAYHLSSNASQEQEPQASLLFDTLGTPCNFELPPCQYIRSLCISPLFPHTHTHALFPIFFFFSISKRSLTVCAMMPWASFSRVRHMCIVCRCISIGPWKNLILLMDPNFSRFQILFHMYLYWFMCVAWSSTFVQNVIFWVLE